MAIETINKYFAQRISVEEQSSKMADIWPIENVWAILRQKLSGNEYENVKDLKQAIIKEWKMFTLELCNRLISSICRRLKAVVEKNGNQVVKKDY